MRLNAGKFAGNAFGEARQMTGLRSTEAPAKFTNKVAFDRKDIERKIPYENQIDYRLFEKNRGSSYIYVVNICSLILLLNFTLTK